MKKKFSLLFISLLLCLGYVNAESIDDKVTVTTHSPQLVGYHWVKSYNPKKTSTKTDYKVDNKVYKGMTAAKAACKRATGSSNASACSYSMVTVKSKCTLDNVGNLKPQACRTHIAKGKSCTKTGKNSYKCVLANKTYTGSKAQSNCNRYCLNYTKSCNGSCQTDQANTTYKIGVNKTTTSGGNYVDQIEPSNIWNYVLKSASGTTDNAYCLQPGKKGPAGDQYCLNKQVNLNDCDDKLQKHYYCGLAQALFYTMKAQTDSNGKTTFVDSGEYGYGSITTALRMWAAYYGSVKGSSIGGLNEIGLENGNFDYYTNTPVYLNTAKAAASGYTGNPCATTKSNNNMGVLCGDVMDPSKYQHSYTRSITLFNKVLAMFNGKGGKFLDGLLGGTNDDKFKLDVRSGSGGDASMSAAWPKSFIEQSNSSTTTSSQYKIECTKEELLNKNSACRMYTKVYMEKDGRKTEVPASSIEGSCSKEKCTLEVKGEKVCNINSTNNSSTVKYTFDVVLKGYNSVGLIREYRHCTNPGSYQIMFTAVFNKEKKEQSTTEGGTDKSFSKSTVVSCPCDDTKKCTDFRPISKTLGGDASQASCGNSYDGYDKFDKADPYMNCILNPCNDSDKLQFRREPDELGLNKNVCDVYCRKEVVFFLANKKKVYAGMQFRYDIGPAVLGCEDDVDEIVKKDAALTSIVLQKKQCTSEIYYDQPNKYGNKKSWLEQYDEAVKEMMEAFTEWKRKESTYSWETDINGKPDEVLIEGKQCYAGTGCPGTCNPSTYLPPIQWYLYWPNKGSSQAFKYCKASTGAEKGVNFNLNCGGSSYNTSSGRENRASSCSGTRCNCSTCCSTRKDGSRSCHSCNCDHGYRTSGSCVAGQAGNYSTAKNEENAAYQTYKAKLDAVAQLIYDLQNCNMYVASGTTAPKIEDAYQSVSTWHHGTVKASINKSAKGSAKNIILDESVCDEGGDDCAEMSLEYEDELYGKNVTIEKETKTLPSKNLNETYFCKNNDDNNPDCYEYKKDQEVELRKGNQVKNHDLIECEGTMTSVKCTKNKISLPTNDYSSFVIVTETDFWRSDKFSANAYTGLIGDGDGNGLSTPLGNEEYPVSNGLTTGGSTGNYEVKQHIDNVKIVVDDNVSLDYTCSYDVYNTTNLYDCATKTKDGKLDLTACKNSCYQVIAGVPVIKPECSEFDIKDTNSKGYGFVYRNVDLNNLFPNETKRPTGINWGSDLGKEVTNKIEQKGTDLFVNDENIRYSFVLSPTAINRIREYNTQQEVMGVGYQDNSYLSCELVTDTINQSGLKGFYRCRSKFLEEISQSNNNYDIITKKFSNPGEGGN